MPRAIPDQHIPERGLWQPAAAHRRLPRSVTPLPFRKVERPEQAVAAEEPERVVAPQEVREEEVVAEAVA